ncbi:acylneuraminate cytidylyltransferase family protein [Magnetofaba australis]|uniref:Putative Cytidylyltransferase n=1 Tax=Magnetofaba australis IT-1 TaxID=1434232 RepID=A0A1Y2JZZ3_9PROT|nr:acylneuraminate cytidylyltransferase family protein [Magnetofaba australis]OSM00114.1 putative Cytidylyltransferase [Magnetofaba australis IT-1]
MKTLAIIPARGGSKGLPRKNVLKLRGKPLVAYPIAAAMASGACDRVFVTTDDAEIADAAREAGADVPFLRPADLAADVTTMEATLQQALEAYEAHTGETFEIVVFLTPTDVFREPEWIAKAVELMKADPALESAFAGRPDFKNYWEPLPDGGWQRVRSYMQVYGQRQERLRNGRVIYREDTGLTCATRASIIRSGRRIGNKVELIPCSHLADLDIHTALDLHLAEATMAWLEQHPNEEVY